MSASSDALLHEAAARFSPTQVAELTKAVRFAEEAHRGQVRGTGEPYVEHCFAVATILLGWKLDAPTVTAAILHDVPEDTDRTIEELRFAFGDEVGKLVSSVTKLSGVRVPHHSTTYQAENLRRLFLAMAEDIRVVLLKLADRLHNMRTLKGVKPHKRKRIGLETLEVFAPLADRLGMGEVRSELDDLGFRYAYPTEYQWTSRQVRQSAAKRDRYIAIVKRELADLLKEEGINAEINARTKNLYSLYRKLLQKERDIDRIYDLFAVRVIVSSTEECYRGMGIVHRRFQPLPHRIKDYIAVPKSNGYQSLHTTIFGPENRLLEVQFRTVSMHEEAELGVAAHAIYAEGKQAVTAAPEQLAVMNQLSSWHDELAAGGDFEGMKLDLFSKRVFVFSPHGDIHSLPAGATPVDFAYTVHTEVGHTCVGAKVNGVIVPLETELTNGDVVEILTKSGSKPKRDWLQFVRTGQARTAIRSALRKDGRSANLKAGQARFSEIATRLKLPAKAILRDHQAELIAGVPHAETLEDVYAAMGEGLVSEERIQRLISPLLAPAPARRKAATASGTVKIQGATGVRTRMARCCKPVPPVPIAGYVTVGHGITVHRRACRQVTGGNPQRVVSATWH
jgi:guanosine-3',5'-bis(diphosphate) 3'-pyrophosphohydrolase